MKELENWIRQGQEIIEERNENHSYLIEKHRNFFRTTNDDILQPFLRSARAVLHEQQQRRDADDIQLLMENLQRQYNDIVAHAPQRLARLQFERIEKILLEQIRLADDELTEELILLEREKETNDILRRHNEYFQWNHFHSTIETHFQQISNHSIEHLKNLWDKLQKRIVDVHRKLQTVPKQWQEYQEKCVKRKKLKMMSCSIRFRFRLIENWMRTIEHSMNQTKNTDVSFEEYKVIANLFKVKQ